MMRASLIGIGVFFLTAFSAQGQSPVSFARLPVEPIAEGSPIWVATADVDNDGNLDLVVTNTDSDQITILFGNGDGSFVEPGATYSLDLSAGPRSLVLADFNGDQMPDIISANEVSNTVSVMINRDGIFDPAIETAVGTSPSEVVVADFNNDG